MTRDFDVVIIGGGNAGMGATIATSEAGLSIAMIEPSLLGGTCSNRGCTPKKVLVAAAHSLDEIARAGEHRIKVGKARLDWAGLIAREKAIIRDIPARLRKTMDERGVTLIDGRGRFRDPNAVAVGNEVLEARHIVVATGSKPRALSIPGAELMITSDDVLSDPRQPRDVVFIGGGAIAFEFAHVYVRAGTGVTILEAGPRFLASFDEDAVNQILAESQRIGISAMPGITVRRIEKAGRQRRVVYEAGGTEHAIEADRVVNGAGRIADIDGLDLDAGSVAIEKGRIVTDGHLRSTTNPAVHVCGDALPGKPQLSPIATYEGTLVGRAIAGGTPASPDYASIPACLYTVPALATVGMTEAEARRAGRDIRIATNDMRDWLSGRTFAEAAAWAKVIIDRPTGAILGAHMVGHGGEELIHIFALAMRHGITAASLKEAVYAFPTYAADLRSML